MFGCRLRGSGGKPAPLYAQLLSRLPSTSEVTSLAGRLVAEVNVAGVERLEECGELRLL